MQTPGLSDYFGLINKDSFMERNFNLSNDLNAGDLEESEEENGIILIHGKETDEGSKIDVETFKNHVVKFRNESRRVMRKINDHTADDVHIVGANYYKSK